MNKCPIENWIRHYEKLKKTCIKRLQHTTSLTPGELRKNQPNPFRKKKKTRRTRTRAKAAHHVKRGGAAAKTIASTYAIYNNGRANSRPATLDIRGWRRRSRHKQSLLDPAGNSPNERRGPAYSRE